MGCQQTRGKKELIRVVRTPDQQVRIDATGKLSGRGAYLCRDAECLALALAGKKLQRALHVDMSPEIVNDLRDRISAGQAQKQTPRLEVRLCKISPDVD